MSDFKEACTFSEKCAIDRAMQSLRMLLPIEEDGVRKIFVGEQTARSYLETLALELRVRCTACQGPLSLCPSCAAKKIAKEKVLPAAKKLAAQHGPSLVMWLGDKLQDFMKEDDQKK